ncbi:lipoprotein [Achromobacter sp. F4_2707]|uniref:LPS translocon maturation chaperone LptM n=1 Tax=Achromobacter sp. F4_2707 TaxID=3114286 RepID=UPI0039C6164A
MQTPFQLPVIARRSMRLIACGLMLSGLLACGYKGPLYMPPPEDPPTTLTTPPGHDAPPGPSTR